MKPDNDQRFQFVADSGKYFIGPKNCAELKERMEARIERLASLEQNSFNVLELRGREMGIIASGGAYQEARKRHPDASVLRLRLAYPLVQADVLRLRDHVVGMELVVFEDGDPVVMRQVQELASRMGFSARQGGSLRHQVSSREYAGRLCPACPHRGVLYALKALGRTVAGDAGCSALASLAPLECVHTHTAMGASIAMAAGMNNVACDDVVALIGDAAFFHSGINALVDAVTRETDLLIVILDNGAAALTGGQLVAGKTDQGAQRANWTELLASLGVQPGNITVTGDIYQRQVLRDHIRCLSGRSGVKVLVVQGSCRHELAGLPDLLACETDNLTLQEWPNACEDCFAIAARVEKAVLVATRLCGACDLCQQTGQ